MFPNARKLTWRQAAPLLVAALTLLVFWPCLHLSFVNYDDPLFLNPSVLGLSLASLRRLFCSPYFGNYSPLPQLSLAVDFAIWNGNPLGYHLTSLIFHAANAALFYAFCLEIFGHGKPSGRDRLASAAAALFFSLHPLRVQSVAWISERRDVVCGLFFLMTLLFWLRAHRAHASHAGRWRALALGAFLPALLSKATAIPLPAILILLAIHPLNRLPLSPRYWGKPAARALWKETAPFFALSAIFSVISVLAQRQIDAVISLARAAPKERAFQILVGLVFYLGKTVWPFGLSFYEWHWAPIRTTTLLGAAVTIGLMAAAAISRRLRPHLLTALMYQTLMLIPVLSVTFGHEIVADRFTYLSGLAWAVLVGAGLRKLSSKYRLLGTSAVAAVLILLSVHTRTQIKVWTNSTTLWRRALQSDPMSWVARPNLAQAVLSEGRLQEAILLLEEQLRVYPGDWEVRQALTKIIASAGTPPPDHVSSH